MSRLETLMAPEVDTLSLGPVGTNCYVVRAERGAAEAVVVDPSGSATEIRLHLAGLGARCAAILVTHGHFDHVADAGRIAARTGATVVSNFEICEWLARQGAKMTQPMNLGGSIALPFGRVKLTLAHHSSTLPDGSAGGNPCGFLLTLPALKIYFACDTGLFYDMKLIGAAGLGIHVMQLSLTKRQLQREADSAAMAGAYSLFQGRGNSAAIAAANKALEQNDLVPNATPTISPGAYTDSSGTVQEPTMAGTPYAPRSFGVTTDLYITATSRFTAVAQVLIPPLTTNVPLTASGWTARRRKYQRPAASRTTETTELVVAAMDRRSVSRAAAASSPTRTGRPTTCARSKRRTSSARRP